ncbi:hypothetical protein [Nodularia sp. NIES-3585]|uniref:hypothetical protein n=1 Tax=Nodularia sp. NIES-3585 TaxID=1973477 RepID=UPI000B5C807D|nr:hypothetical protein [Nodularia sp. NIES-3585]GAX35813.1 hypothetical protein NIES3585_18320 [Nodularia sp. NIES-3585]
MKINHKPSPDPNSSGVSVNFRLSETLIAALVSSFVSFGAGVAIANNQSQNVNQNCTVEQPSTTSVSPNMPLTPKD